MGPLLGIIAFAIQAAIWIVIASVILSWVSRVIDGPWVNAPLFDNIIRFGRAICEPVRRLMERFGMPTRPFDFSPMIVVFALQCLGSLVSHMLGGR